MNAKTKKIIGIGIVLTVLIFLGKMAFDYYSIKTVVVNPVKKPPVYKPVDIVSTGNVSETMV